MLQVVWRAGARASLSARSQKSSTGAHHVINLIDSNSLTINMILLYTWVKFPNFIIFQ